MSFENQTKLVDSGVTQLGFRVPPPQNRRFLVFGNEADVIEENFGNNNNIEPQNAENRNVSADPKFLPSLKNPIELIPGIGQIVSNVKGKLDFLSVRNEPRQIPVKDENKAFDLGSAKLGPLNIKFGSFDDSGLLIAGLLIGGFLLVKSKI